jgi:hypothetical protein
MSMLSAFFGLGPMELLIIGVGAVGVFAVIYWLTGRHHDE